MGESIFEGTVTKWLKKEGETVKRDEPLFEISTDKVDSEIPSPAAGTLQKILVKEGETVQINTVVAVIGDGAGKPAETAPAKTEAAKPEPVKPQPPKAVAKHPDAKNEPASTTKEGPAPVAGPAEPEKPEAEEQEKSAVTDRASSSEESDRTRSSPLVRRIAREHGVDLNALSGKGTGIEGRVTKADILSYIEQGGKTERPLERPTQKPAEPPAARPSPAGPAQPQVTFTGEVERVPMTAMRKAIAEHMVASRRTSAHVTTFFEVDCSRILKAKEKLREEFERSGVHLSVTPFFVQAVVHALKKFPVVNASLENDSIVYKKAINVGIAVSLDWGLIVPVVKNADEKNLLGLARTIADLGQRARTKKLAPDDVQDGTFTITNPGQFGALTGTPIINQPQVAIMGMGGITKRAVVIDDAIAIRPIIVLSLSFDHRIIDGAIADMFMSEVRQGLENWDGSDAA
jgi:2-oxoglutarate dehydrogenase E2 component (dihydrolipoamide succinyltransferase)